MNYEELQMKEHINRSDNRSFRNFITFTTFRMSYCDAMILKQLCLDNLNVNSSMQIVRL